LAAFELKLFPRLAAFELKSFRLGQASMLLRWTNRGQPLLRAAVPSVAARPPSRHC